MEFLFALFLIALVVGFYFLPSIVAFNRNHKNRIPIALVNLFFGFTFFGWVAALVWAFTANTEA